MDEINKIPPVTRFLVGATLAVTIPVLLHFLDIRQIVFVTHYIYPGLQLWRIPTSFFFGGSGIGLIFDMIMLYRNSDSLETTRYSRRSYDYAWQLILCAIALIIVNRPIYSSIHFRAFLVTLIYLSCKLDPESSISLFGLVTIPAKYFPYTMIVMDLLSGGGPIACAGTLTGIIVGHAWWLLAHRDPAQAPAIASAPGWFKGLIGTGETQPQVATAGDPRPFGAAAAPRGRTMNDGGPRAGGGGSGSTGGYNWGSGQRLGSG